MTTVKCIVCDSAVAEPLYAGILRCRECGHVFADLQLSDEQLFELYSERFFTGGEFGDYPASEPYIRRNFEARFKVLRSFLDPARHRHLLEIGSAYGFFLDHVRGHFASAQGLDITDAGVRYARERLKIDVTQADFLTHDFGAQRFDVVCLWDTIEHLRSPQFFLEKIAEQTESGALLALTTGDIGSLNARLRKERWRMIHPPTHLHYFSRQTLTRLLNSYGFDVIYDRYCGFHRSADDTAYMVLVLRHGKNRLYELLRRSRVTEFGFYLNLYDILYVIARRR
ncbi:MAG: class I SAM-dependent methyltransferase [Pyrinomonadaceae bacterium]|nr:class I SAM-dependent methyltransferase [Pyrinomonadaceae bacterium]